MFLTKKNVVETIQKTILEAFGEKTSNLNKVIDLQKKMAKLNDEYGILKEQLIDLQVEHKKEKTEIEFLVAMKEKKQKIEAEENAVAVEKKVGEKEMALQKEYFDKTVALLDEHKKEMGKLTDAILKRLPDVNMHINKGYKED